MDGFAHPAFLFPLKLQARLTTSKGLVVLNASGKGAVMDFEKRGFAGLLLREAGLLLAGMMVVGSVMLAVGVASSLKAMHLEESGVDVKGVVTGLHERSYRCGERNRATCHEYRVDYIFQPEGWRAWPASTKVDRAFFQGLQRGDALAVRYVAGNPAEHEIEPGEARSESWLGLIIGGGLWLAVGVAAPWHVQKVRRAVFLRDNGVVRQTRVIAKYETSFKVNNTSLYRIMWDNPRGESWAARAGNLPEVGTEITVFAHPEGKWPSVWQGDVGRRSGA
jgi:hypothetical protein